MARDASYPHHFNDFEATIDIFHDGKHVRSLQYSDCKINNVVIDTLEDKEEAYLGKGFAVIEHYTVECTGYAPHAIDYDLMMEANSPKHSQQLNSLDLLEQRAAWESQHGINSSVDNIEKNPTKMNPLERIGNSAVHSEYRDY